jgi:HlyD family secretion protein
MKKIFFLTVIVLLVAGGAYLKYNSAAVPQSTFRTTTVTHGDVVATISATGTVQAEDVIDVGAQVTGRIESLGPDPRGLPDSTSPDKDKFKNKFIDYCTPVKQGDLLAQLDQSVYRAQLDQAKANLTRSEADLEQMKAKLAQTEQEWNRAQTLKPENAISKSDYDLAAANYKMAKANIGVGQAVIKQNQAALDMAEKNFGYTTIYSPVNGVVIARRVNIGQTVVSNLSASSLFLIGTDLRKMEVWALVNEADIGRVQDHPNMSVRFTVDAYPHDIFQGKIEQVRLNASSTQNVVLYTVVVSFENPDRKVLPYMTANLRFDVERADNVLQVPNTALRWKPKLEQVVPELREKMAPLLVEKDDKDPSSEKKPETKETSKLGKTVDLAGRVWIRDGLFVRPIEVQKGVTDGTVTEVSGADLKDKLEIVIGEKTPEEINEATNPFVPKFFNKKH